MDRPDRREILAALQKVISRAEDCRALPRTYAWHRRFVMRIDCRLEAVEERLKPKNLSGDLNLDRAAEMTYQWLKSQNEPEGSIERAMLLQQAQDLMEEVTRDD